MHWCAQLKLTDQWEQRKVNYSGKEKREKQSWIELGVCPLHCVPAALDRVRISWQPPDRGWNLLGFDCPAVCAHSSVNLMTGFKVKGSTSQRDSFCPPAASRHATELPCLHPSCDSGGSCKNISGTNAKCATSPQESTTGVKCDSRVHNVHFKVVGGGLQSVLEGWVSWEIKIDRNHL